MAADVEQVGRLLGAVVTEDEHNNYWAASVKLDGNLVAVAFTGKITWMMTTRELAIHLATTMDETARTRKLGNLTWLVEVANMNHG